MVVAGCPSCTPVEACWLGDACPDGADAPLEPVCPTKTALCRRSIDEFSMLLLQHSAVGMGPSKHDSMACGTSQSRDKLA